MSRYSDFYADGILKEFKRLNHNLETLSETLLKRFDDTGEVRLTKSEYDLLVGLLCKYEKEKQESDD